MLYYNMIVLTIAISAYLIYLALQDLQHMQVSTYDVYMVVALSVLLTSNIYSILISAGLASILYYSKHFIGDGDIIIITALTSTIPFTFIPYWFLCIGLSNLAVHQYLQRRVIPMLPSIAISFITIQLLSLIIR